MRYLALTLAAAAALSAAVPAFAQTVDELTVTGRSARAPQAITETVSYADLDLSYARDRDILRQRINITAGRLCDRLNEPRRAAGNLGRSCQDIAVRDALGQVRLAVADARSSASYADAYGAPVSAVAADGAYDGSGPVPDTQDGRAR